MISLDNKKEFRRSYHEYYPLVFSAVYSKTKNLEDAEDICHEVFIRYSMNYGTIEKHRGWLMKAVSFEVSNYYRKKEANRDDFMDIDMVSDSRSHYFENGFRDSRIILQEAIENEGNFSGEREMMLFELVAKYHFTCGEAARYLGITRRQALKEYRKTSIRILHYLKSKGIKGIEDLL